MEHVEYRSRYTATPAEVFAFHERPDAFLLLVPPWEEVRVVSRTGDGLAVGTRIVLETRVGPLWLRWTAVHDRYVPGQEFTDHAESGPFRRWEHTHRVGSDGAGGAWLTDAIDFALPVGALGALVAGSWVRRRLDRMFRYRHEVTARETHARILEGHGA